MASNGSSSLLGSQCFNLSPPFDPLEAKALLVFTHVATLLVLCSFAERLYERTEDAGHPVFVIVFQDVTVMCIAQALELLISLPVVFGLDGKKYYLALHFFLSDVTLVFNKVSWLTVTMLRYVFHIFHLQLPQLSRGK